MFFAESTEVLEANVRKNIKTLYLYICYIPDSIVII